MDMSNSDNIRFPRGCARTRACVYIYIYMCKATQSCGCAVGCWATEVKYGVRNSDQYLLVEIHIAPVGRHWIRKMDLILVRWRRHFQLGLYWNSYFDPIQSSELAVGSSVQLSLESSYVKIKTEVKDPESVLYSDPVGFVFCESPSWNAAAVFS